MRNLFTQVMLEYVPDINLKILKFVTNRLENIEKMNKEHSH